MKNPTQSQLDVLKEVVNIGVGQAAKSLNDMLNSHVELTVPEIYFYDPLKPEDRLVDKFESILACVRLSFEGNFSGQSMLVFPTESAVKLVAALTDETPGSIELNAVMSETLNEVGNIVINGVMGSISNFMKRHLHFSLPIYMEGELKYLLKYEKAPSTITILLVTTNFVVADRQINGNIFIIFELESFGHLLSEIDLLSGTA